MGKLGKLGKLGKVGKLGKIGKVGKTKAVGGEARAGKQVADHGKGDSQNAQG